MGDCNRNKVRPKTTLKLTNVLWVGFVELMNK